MYGDRELKWDGLTLKLRSGLTLGEVVADLEFSGMYRVAMKHRDQLSDMVNLTRAKDAAKTSALAHLNAYDAGPR
jgi:hypothetical protein